MRDLTLSSYLRTKYASELTALLALIHALSPKYSISQSRTGRDEL